ncbi:MAG: type III-B CRISPR module-associated protein Cmr5 [Mariprofundales bacterium]|nr:type III-B CRISPR module-associated protein Cmr5 [Mariprofundales bacterium]
MRDKDQIRAAFAWQQVEQAKAALGDGYKEYKNLAKGAPAMMMSNGLMATLAFFNAKGKEHHQLLCNDILQWLAKELSISEEYGAVMEKMFHSDSATYRCATDETMQLLRWLRQFADS